MNLKKRIIILWKFISTMIFSHLFLVLISLIASFLVSRHYINQAFLDQLHNNLIAQTQIFDRKLKTGKKIDILCSELKERYSFEFVVLNGEGNPLCTNMQDAPSDIIYRQEFLELEQRNSHFIRTNHYTYNISRHLYEGIDLFLWIKLSTREFEQTLESIMVSLLVWVLPGTLLLSLLLIIPGLKFFWPIVHLLFQLRGIRKRLRDNPSLVRKKKMVNYNIDEEWRKAESFLSSLEKDLESKNLSLKAESEKIEALSNSISDAIVAIDLNETILFSNHKFKGLFLRESRDQGLKIWEIFRAPDLLEKFKTSLYNKKTAHYNGLQIDLLKGGVGYFDLSIGPIQGADNKIQGILAVFHDVTEMKMVESMRADFVANVSHEMRTPLTSIKGFAQVLDNNKEELDGSSQMAIEKIISNVAKIEHLYSDILDLSLLESKKSLDRNWFKTETLVQNVLTNLKQKHRAIFDKINISTQFDCQRIWGNGNLIEQVISNYIDNAIKYMNPKENDKNSLQLNIHVFDKEGFSVISVEDNGRGIDEESIPRVFERFFRIDPSRSAEVKGTGLGLAIVKHITQKHGGKVWVESQINKGSTFYASFRRPGD